MEASSKWGATDAQYRLITFYRKPVPTNIGKKRPQVSICFWLSQMREGEAPSYFNAEEALALVGLVEGLLAQTRSKGRDSVQPNDLGVIATYRKQVRGAGLGISFGVGSLVHLGSKGVPPWPSQIFD